MSQHAKVAQANPDQMLLRRPLPPWQRGSNANTNGLLRECMPKHTDLSIHTAQDLEPIADELNHRPRKRLGYLTPREVFDSLITKDLMRVASTP